MVGPARKREAVGHLQRELELSQRRACKVVGQPRATQRTWLAPLFNWTAASITSCHVRVSAWGSPAARYACAIRRFSCGWRCASLRACVNRAASCLSRVLRLDC